MTNSETRRYLERIHNDLAQRFECFERKVTDRIDKFDDKVDEMGKNCVGCAREFGEISTTARNNAQAMKDHQTGHRWNAGFAATIGGIIVAIATFFVRLFRD